jgi:hypothetical protein
MPSLPIRSRWGNMVLLSIGLLFVISSGTLLAIAVTSTWGYAGTSDYIVIALLLLTTTTGGWFVHGARTNLRSRTNSLQEHAAAQMI